MTIIYMHDGLCTVLYRGGSSRPSTFAQISLVMRGVPDRTSLLPSVSHYRPLFQTYIYLVGEPSALMTNIRDV